MKWKLWNKYKIKIILNSQRFTIFKHLCLYQFPAALLNVHILVHDSKNFFFRGNKIYVYISLSICSKTVNLVANFCPSLWHFWGGLCPANSHYATHDTDGQYICTPTYLTAEAWPLQTYLKAESDQFDGGGPNLSDGGGPDPFDGGGLDLSDGWGTRPISRRRSTGPDPFDGWGTDLSDGGGPLALTY